jgi:hypothetical protein
MLNLEILFRYEKQLFFPDVEKKGSEDELEFPNLQVIKNRIPFFISFLQLVS